MIVFAHAGHWLASVAYAAPVLALLAWMGVVKVRDMRKQRRASTIRPEGD